MKTYSIVTLGCKVNQYESATIASTLDAMGFQYKKFPDICDIYVINTCTVTAMSDRKSRQMIGKARASNTDSIIIATGCSAQADAQALHGSGADIVLGNNEKSCIDAILSSYLKEKNGKLTVVSDIFREIEYMHGCFPDKWERTRGYLKIQDGCDNFCSYCIIPYVRGRARSRDIDDIVKEARYMASKGIKEVVLTGIHLDSYGKDKGNLSIIDVISKINDIEGIERIRLGSLEPKIITETFVEEIKKYDKLCPHFHMSLQSGSDAVLSDMRRRYDSEMFLNAVNMLRNNIPDLEFTTDIIVGYPTETEEDFNKSLEMVEKARFIKVHVFKYSKRPGTTAAKLKTVDGKILNGRSEKLINYASEISKSRLSGYLGRTLRMLIEEGEDGFITGHTANYIKVQAPSDDNTADDCINTFCDVLICGLTDDGLMCEVVAKKTVR